MPYRDPAARRANAADYREKNRERIGLYASRWKKRNRRKKVTPQLYIKSIFNGVKSRRWEGDNLEVNDLYELYETQRGRCALTGHVLTHSLVKEDRDTNISVDRIDSNKGYRKGNVRLVCFRINVMRMDLSDSALRRWCQLIMLGPEECWHIPDDCSVSI